MHFDAGADEGSCDVGLQVGKAEHEVGLERDDALDIGAGEGRHLGLLAPSARRAHREARNSDNAPLLAEKVERFGRLLGQADDALGEFGAHVHG